MNRILIGLFCLAVPLACQPNTSQPQPNQVVSSNPQSVAANDPFSQDRPPIGDKNTVRQSPYGLSSSSSQSLRLTRILVDGHPCTDYHYDQQGRLSEKIDYYNDGHIAQSTRFTYQPTGSINVEYWLNQQVIQGEGLPANNTLVLNLIVSFASTNSGAELVQTSQKIPASNNPDYPQSYYLAFSSSGQLVWKEKPSSSGLSGEYTLYRRDQAGNISQTKYVRQLEANQSYVSTYQYDQQNNPYRTTGDLTDDRTTNVNNILSEEFNPGDGQKKLYQYAYRSDGYPSQVSYSTASQGIAIQTFVYNQ